MPSHVHNRLIEAADLIGATLNQFVVQSALEKAQKIIEQETTLNLSKKDAQIICNLLENPPQANTKLKAAVALHRKLVNNA